MHKQNKKTLSHQIRKK